VSLSQVNGPRMANGFFQAPLREGVRFPDVGTFSSPPRRRGRGEGAEETRSSDGRSEV
jgi:hypothetical protein